MSTDVAMFRNVENLTIEGGTFNFNASVVELVDFTTTGSDTIIPHDTHLYLLLAKAAQLMRLLPRAHLELARQCAGWGKRRTSMRHDLGNNIISVGVPLFSSSLFASSPVAVQFVAFYILLAVVVIDILHPLRKLESTRLSHIVKIFDALGRYHDFSWSACQNFNTFHEEFVKRSRNMPGYSFVRSRWYEIEYDGQVLHQDDWKAIKPFSLLFVDFVIVQNEEPTVECPWCKHENLLPSSSADSKHVTCSCAQCDRDFSVNPSPSVGTNIGDDVVNRPSPHRPNIIPGEILRLRIQLQLSTSAPVQGPEDHEQPSTPLLRSRKGVAFGDQISEEVHIADEWDRTPSEPTRRLTYQDLLELKEIQRSLPHANQPYTPLPHISSLPHPHSQITARPIPILTNPHPPSPPSQPSATTTNLLKQEEVPRHPNRDGRLRA